MKSRMTLRMGKILEARTAPGNQQRMVVRRKRWEGGERRMGCDLVFTQRGEQPEGQQRKRGNGTDESSDEYEAKRERETKKEKHIRIHFSICSLCVSTS